MNNLFPSNEIVKEATYFAITIGADENGKWWSETQTYFLGFEDEDFRVELRKIRAVYPDKMAAHWESYRQPFCVVNDDSGFVRWQLGGGHALITEEQTLKHVPEEVEPRPCVKEGAFGFTDIKKLPKTAFQKAPTPKLRMEVLKRDKYRCMICGQRPADDVNIQLHAHHIRPYGNSGVTTEKNLISLCHTCHTGLEPHYEYTLFDLVEKRFGGPEGQIKKRSLEKYISAVQNYRKSVRALLAAGQTRRPKSLTGFTRRK
jgi:5-methylcytosine-specific restriction endonuclease McrA